MPFKFLQDYLIVHNMRGTLMKAFSTRAGGGPTDTNC